MSAPKLVPASPRFRLDGPADAKAIAAVVDIAGQAMTGVSAKPAQSFRISDGQRHTATFVTGLGRTRDGIYPGCFAALVQAGRVALVSTIGSGAWEAQTCGGTTAVGILSLGETVAIGLLAQASSPNAQGVEPIVLQWTPATGALRIDEDLSRRASLAGATTVDAIRRSAAAAPAAVILPEPATLPRDVRAFVERRNRCDHLRGEDVATGEALDAIERACRGTDAELARLRRDHAGDAAIIHALADYDPEVE